MPGGGSILGMIISLRNNKQLLRKKNRFDRRRMFSGDDPQNLIYGGNTPLEFKHISENELEEFRIKIRERNRKNLRRRIIGSTLILFIVGFGIYWLTINIDRELVKIKREAELATFEQNNFKYDLLVRSGDNYVLRSEWAEAIFEYRKALVIFPDIYEANYKLADAYMKSCMNDNMYCSEGKKHLDKIIALFPEEVKLLEIRATLFLAAGETEKALADYDRINEILSQ
jgi:tetratricopeptide (TPR) repeat protein